ncbi:MAG TPA: hypothetical protein VH325_18705 [Bryobacteraceae bacterium]|nr:hypothetical protein [Bryobacteraceae bacterium]
MRATKFEVRHQVLIHQLIIACAFLTYLFDRDDIVWKFVKESPASRELERTSFVIATVVLGAAAGISTWASAYRNQDLRANSKQSSHTGPYRYFRYPHSMGDLFYAIGLGSLAPVEGFVILLAGEAIRLLRLTLSDDELKYNTTRTDRQWSGAFRIEAAKWGILLTMIVFTITLNDRVAEVLAGTSALVWMLLNARRQRRDSY